jgi:SAM-dependent methyltransferase
MHEHEHRPHTAKMPRRFDPTRAHRLDDPERFAYLPPDAIVDFVDAPADAVCLDFGTGTGTYAIAFAQRRPDCTVLALDVEPEMLAHLRVKPGGSLVQSGGPELLAAYAGRIDRVLALNVLHEVDDEDLRALFAALRPSSARAAFIDWNADVERPVGPSKAHLYGPQEAAQRLARFGFVVERTALFLYHYALYGSLSGV